MKQVQEIQYKSPMLKFLQKQGVDFTKTEHTSYTLKCCENRSNHSSRTCTHGMMDLAVETFYEGKFLKVSVCHYYEQNGDLMTDPEIVYRAYPKFGTEVPEYFKQDGCFAREDHVFMTKDGQELYNSKLLKSLESFTKTWVENLKCSMTSCTKDEDE